MGLLDQEPQQPTQPQTPHLAPQPPAGADRGEGGSDFISEGSDQDLEKATIAALDILYQPDSISAAAEALGGESPHIAAAELAASLIATVDEKSGGTIPEDTVLPAAVDVLGEVMNFAEEKGIHEFSEGEENNAMSALIARLMKVYDVSEEEYMAFMEENQGENGQAVEQFGRSLAAGA